MRTCGLCLQLQCEEQLVSFELVYLHPHSTDLISNNTILYLFYLSPTLLDTYNKSTHHMSHQCKLHISLVILYLLLKGQSSGFTTPNTSSRTHTQLNMAKISSVKAREILDSRGNPTVEVRSRFTQWNSIG